MRTRLIPPAPRRHERGMIAALEKAHTRAMAEVVAGARDEFRDEVLAAGLGHKLANAIRSVSYPVGVKASMSPAGVVFATPGKAGSRSAATVLAQYNRGSPITPALGEALAVPSASVPMAARGKRRMSPVEVEAAFNQELYPRRLKSGHIGLFLNVAKSRNGRAYRPATARRAAQGRVAVPVLMFTLARRIPGQKRLEFDRIFKRWGDRLGEITAVHVEFEG